MFKLFSLLLASSFIASTTTAKAEDNSNHLPKERYLVLAIGLKDTAEPMHKEDTSYHCSSTNKELSNSFTSADFKVRYINIGNNSLAILPIVGGDMVLSNVVAADGAKYIGGEYTWWNKGKEATLSKSSLPEATLSCLENKQISK